MGLVLFSSIVALTHCRVHQRIEYTDAHNTQTNVTWSTQDRKLKLFLTTAALTGHHDAEHEVELSSCQPRPHTKA